MMQDNSEKSMTDRLDRAERPKTQTSHWRPRYHFTPARNWINDPNGLVYFEGEYHLFYQYNPHGKEWGHMSWGHAVSADLLAWEELPVAIPEKEFMIFSGCAVIDHENSSGLSQYGRPPLVALYTAHFEQEQRQVQHLAYSLDRGRSWFDHPANPVIDRGMAHFRDPKVFWHAPSAAWVMVVALAQQHKVAIYRSPNLIDWDLASEFGPCGSTAGQWECPDILHLSVEGEAGKVWMLKIDVDKDFVGSVNGAQIFFGEFDGFAFVPFDPAGQIGDMGADFYAAQSWSNLPETDADPVWIGWMSNHQSGHHYPTDPWRGTMTLPRAIAARRDGDAWQLVQQPVPAWERAMATAAARVVVINDNEHSVLGEHLLQHTGELRFRCPAGSRPVFTIGDWRDPTLRIAVDGTRRIITVERYAKTWDAVPTFEEPMRAEWTCDQPEVRMVFDRQSVEIFVPEAGISMTACYFAEGDARLGAIGDGLSLNIQVAGIGYI